MIISQFLNVSMPSCNSGASMNFKCLLPFHNEFSSVFCCCHKILPFSKLKLLKGSLRLFVLFDVSVKFSVMFCGVLVNLLRDRYVLEFSK